ncbi:hypothetical protein [Zobellia barbeyronii]|uniref:Uncharacterized protein n=1 Tax=Zobellia barbeyronii TaxID=2748009 RepID=A0ABS5WAR4_9FLAO|nr:hypothetical protein [Zobellia barbeyronii]MBT2160486.1 hypothetical protein [Zobellia barbeyronii]
MKKNYVSIIIVLTIMFLGTFMVQAQQKNFINYQGVARNSENELLEQETLNIGIALKFGSVDAADQYKESHLVTTDANGVFNLQIGSGVSNGGSYGNLPWGEAAFVAVSFNGTEVGTTELMAVPFAIASGDNVWKANGNDIENKNVGEVKIKSDLRILGGFNLNSGNQVNEISDDGALVENSNGILPTQRAVKTYVDNRLFSGGGDAQIASEVPYDNTDSGLTADNVQDALDEFVSKSGGGSDADADPTNELQDISLLGTDLSITDGSTIDLSAIIPPGGTDDQNASEVPFDNTGTGLAAADTQAAIEELASGGLVDTDNQGLIMTGDVLSIEDGTGSVDLNDYVDVTGESGLLLGDGTNISGLEGAADGQVAKWDGTTNKWVAGTDEVGSGGSSLWNANGGDIYFDSGNVGIGLTDPNAIHQIHTNSYQSNSIYTTVDSGDGANDGMYVGLVNDLGLGFTATITNQENGPLRLGTNGTGRLIITNDGNVGIGTVTPSAKFHVDGDIRSSELAGLGERNVVADADGNLMIGGTSGSSSSLWAENGSNIHFNGGNVGIGTETPSSPLEIVSNSDSPILIESTRGDGNGWIRFNKSSGRIGYIGMYGANGEKDIEMGTAGGNTTGNLHLTIGGEPKFTLASNENVGIGNENPSEKLDVAGNIKTAGEVHSNRTGDANLIPIAYGTIMLDGDISTGSGNFTVEKNGLGDYRIKIIGENYLWTRYTTQLTINSSTLGFIKASSVGGDLVVATYATDETSMDIAFNFLVYKP